MVGVGCIHQAMGLVSEFTGVFNTNRKTSVQNEHQPCGKMYLLVQEGCCNKRETLYLLVLMLCFFPRPLFSKYQCL